MLSEDVAVPGGWVGWVVLVVTSGLAGGFLAEWVKVWIAGRDRKHDSSERTADRQHQADLQTDDLASQKASQDAEREHRELLQKRELQQQRDLLEIQREHTEAQRQDQEHTKARQEFIEGIADFDLWIDKVFVDLGYASDEDYRAVQVNQPVRQKPAEVLAYLQRLAAAHPTVFVRRAAQKLWDTIDDEYNVIYDPHDAPSRERLLDWRRRGREIREALHDPRPASPLPD